MSAEASHGHAEPEKPAEAAKKADGHGHETGHAPEKAHRAAPHAPIPGATAHDTGSDGHGGHDSHGDHGSHGGHGGHGGHKTLSGPGTDSLAHAREAMGSVGDFFGTHPRITRLTQTVALLAAGAVGGAHYANKQTPHKNKAEVSDADTTPPAEKSQQVVFGEDEPTTGNGRAAHSTKKAKTKRQQTEDSKDDEQAATDVIEKPFQKAKFTGTYRKVKDQWKFEVDDAEVSAESGNRPIHAMIYSFEDTGSALVVNLEFSTPNGDKTLVYQADNKRLVKPEGSESKQFAFPAELQQ